MDSPTCPCLRHRLILALLSVSLAACGGGGGEAGSTTTPTPAKTSEAITVVQEPAVPVSTLGDPLAAGQWHLLNTNQFGTLAGADLALSGLPETGRGVTVSIIDAAVQIGHADLRRQFLPGQSYSYRTGTADPSPDLSAVTSGLNAAHGTAVAGILAAEAENGIGVRGVAPGARLIAYDPVSLPTAVNLADALARSVEAGAAIINNSWGPLEPATGGTRSFTFAPSIWRAAVLNAVSTGRGGLGSVIVIAAGNGGNQDDLSDYSQFSNDPSVISVGAVDATGRPVSYTEPGFSVLVAGFAGDTNIPAILTTNVQGTSAYAPFQGDGAYTAEFSGTSAATPMVSGVIARMLEANPRLSWRDVRWILAMTASPARLADAALPSPMNSHGFHPLVGFGVVNAQRAVTLARGFSGLPPARTCDLGEAAGSQPGIPEGGSQAVVSWTPPPGCSISTLESVELILASDHPRSGDLEVTLVGPDASTAQVARPHACVGACSSLAEPFSMGISRFMGKPASGQWQLRLRDGLIGSEGRLTSARLILRGH